MKQRPHSSDLQPFGPSFGTCRKFSLTCLAMIGMVQAPAVESGVPDLGEILDAIAENPISNCMNVQLRSVVNPEDPDQGIHPEGWGPAQQGIGEIAPAGSFVATARGNYHHIALDYDNGVQLKRIHRYRENYYPSSFGPGVYSNFDIQLNGNGTNTFQLFDPQVVMALQMRDTDQDGVYQDTRTRAVKSMVLYAETSQQLIDGAPATITVDQKIAQSAVVTGWDGRTWYLDLFNMAEGTGSVDVRARYVARADKAGQLIEQVFYQEDVGTNPALGGEAYFRIASVVAGGQELFFEYQNTIVGNSYPVKKIGDHFGVRKPQTAREVSLRFRR